MALKEGSFAPQVMSGDFFGGQNWEGRNTIGIWWIETTYPTQRSAMH